MPWYRYVDKVNNQVYYVAAECEGDTAALNTMRTGLKTLGVEGHYTMHYVTIRAPMPGYEDHDL